MSGEIHLEQDGAVARVTLANAGKLNAMSRAMWRRLRAVFMAIQADAGVRCVIVHGQGGPFCCGAINKRVCTVVCGSATSKRKSVCRILKSGAW